MKTVLIARHAKSSWEYPSLRDIDRPLKANGVKAAYRLADTLKKRSVHLDALFTSPAARAAHTALIHSRVLEFPENRIQIRSSLYYEGEESIFNLLGSLYDELSSIMICGHNPTFTSFANRLLETPIDNIQTSGVVQLEIPIDSWSDIIGAKAENAIYFKRQEILDLSYAR